MTIAVEVLTSIDQLDAAAYRALRRSCAASAFYDPRVLAAFERAPLLPVEKTFYLAAYEGPALVGFMPAYLQSPAVVDPFDVLRQTTSTRFEAGARGLFSHVMHCYDTTVIGNGGAPVLAPLFERLAALAQAEGAQHFVIMNVAEGPLLAEARGLGLEVSYMFDRYSPRPVGDPRLRCARRGLAPGGSARDAPPAAQVRRERRPRGRGDALRSPGSTSWRSSAHRTTARRGTPQYLPPAPLASLLSSCGDMLRFVVIYDLNDRMVAGFICIDDGPTFHMWLGGMIYEGLDFSPYTVAFAASYRYALAQGKQRIEAGRLNAKIKHRLGLSPMPLHAIVSPGPARARPSAVT